MKEGFERFVLNKLNVIKMQVKFNCFCEVNSLFWLSSEKDGNGKITQFDLLKKYSYDIDTWLEKNNIICKYDPKRRIYTYRSK